MTEPLRRRNIGSSRSAKSTTLEFFISNTFAVWRRGVRYSKTYRSLAPRIIDMTGTFRSNGADVQEQPLPISFGVKRGSDAPIASLYDRGGQLRIRTLGKKRAPVKGTPHLPTATLAHGRNRLHHSLKLEAGLRYSHRARVPAHV